MTLWGGWALVSLLPLSTWAESQEQDDNSWPAPSLPLHLLRAKERGQMAGAQPPPAQGGRMPGGRWWWTDRGLAPLTSVPVPLSLSLVVRDAGTSSVPRVGSQEQKAAQFLSHLA